MSAPTHSSCPDEDTIAAFLSGQVDPAEAERVEQHVDACASCYHLLTSYARAYAASGSGGGSGGRPAPTADAADITLSSETRVARLQRSRTFVPGTEVGRYVVLEWIGEGGVGVVYAAYDPELDRKVALKLLKPGDPRHGGERVREQLLREARAMAKLAHPHVVGVHDVGTFDEQVFVAMEFVEGSTLRGWLAASQRALAEIVATFVQAGRGLAAAHAAGLVHRDFKPENVLMGKDGRPRVSDFGLAFAPQETADGEVHPAGTPAYMPPEQRAGHAIDARSDQYSFCVALYEALYREHPFGRGPDPTLTGDSAARARGVLRDPPPGSQVPARLRRLLTRGLSEAPDNRYPSLEALLDELGEERSSTWRRVWIVAMAVIALGSVAFAIRQTRAQPALMCHGGQKKIDGVWNDGMKRQVAAQFQVSEKPYAADALRGAERTLDAYARRWVAMNDDACEATRVRGEQSEELLDLRMTCLDDRLKEVRSLTDILTHADAVVVSNALAAAESLTPITHCGDVKALTARVKPPSDPVVAAKVADLRAQLGEVKVLHAAGKYVDGRERARQIVAAAQATTDRQVLAEALYWLADLEALGGDVRAAKSRFYEAAWAADTAGDDHLRALVWGQLLFYEGYIDAKYDSARVFHDQAMAAINRAGGDHEAQAELLHAYGAVLGAQGKLEEAQKAQEQSIALKEEIFGLENRQVAFALSNLGVTLQLRGLVDESIGRHRRALFIAEKELGPFHPRLCFLHGNLGSALRLALDLTAARTHLVHAAALAETGIGANNPGLANILMDLVDVLLDQGDFARAAAEEQRALTIQEKVLPPEHPGVATAINGLGKAHLGLGSDKRALEYLERALALRTASKATERRDLADTQFALAQALRRTGGSAPRAIQLATEARDTLRAVRKTPIDARDLKRMEAWLERP